MALQALMWNLLLDCDIICNKPQAPKPVLNFFLSFFFLDLQLDDLFFRVRYDTLWSRRRPDVYLFFLSSKLYEWCLLDILRVQCKFCFPLIGAPIKIQNLSPILSYHSSTSSEGPPQVPRAETRLGSPRGPQKFSGSPKPWHTYIYM